MQSDIVAHCCAALRVYCAASTECVTEAAGRSVGSWSAKGWVRPRMRTWAWVWYYARSLFRAPTQASCHQGLVLHSEVLQYMCCNLPLPYAGGDVTNRLLIQPILATFKPRLPAARALDTALISASALQPSTRCC